MIELLVFDPALCCSTGVCGPEVDSALVRFAADLDWLSSQGVRVQRFNLAHDAAAFAGNRLVRERLQSRGTDCLPLLMVDGEVAASERYPERAEMARLCGVGAPASGTSGRDSHQGAPSHGGKAADAANPCCGPDLVGLGGSASASNHSRCC